MLTRWNNLTWDDWGRQLPGLSDLRKEMDRLFDDFGREPGFYSGRGWPRVTVARPGTWPRTALFDKGDAFVLRAEMPGFSEKDINVTVEQSSLTIRGERQVTAPEGYSVHRRERE